MFLTRRRRCHNDPPHLTVEKTEQVLATLGVIYDGIIEGVTSPRVLINDEGALAIDHLRDSPLDRIALESSRTPQRSDVVSRVYHALAAVAWVAWKFADSEDADDYVQTLPIAKSLTTCGGFNHADLVTRYRTRPGYRFGADALQASGVHPNYKGQVAKLIQNDDPRGIKTVKRLDQQVKRPAVGPGCLAGLDIGTAQPALHTWVHRKPFLNPLSKTVCGPTGTTRFPCFLAPHLAPAVRFRKNGGAP